MKPIQFRHRRRRLARRVLPAHRPRPAGAVRHPGHGGARRGQGRRPWSRPGACPPIARWTSCWRRTSPLFVVDLRVLGGQPAAGARAGGARHARALARRRRRPMWRAWRSSATLVKQGARIQVAEQYIYQPHHAARLAFAQSGAAGHRLAGAGLGGARLPRHEPAPALPGDRLRERAHHGAAASRRP